MDLLPLNGSFLEQKSMFKGKKKGGQDKSKVNRG